MWDIIRDSTIGQLLNWASSGRLASYPEQRPGFVPHERFLKRPLESSEPSDNAHPPAPGTEADAVADVAPGFAPLEHDARDNTSPTDGAATDRAGKVQGGKMPESWVVSLEDNDQDNPQNWSRCKQRFVGFLIALYTFAIYVGSAIYTPAIPSVVEDFGVSSVVATLGLSLFVFGYGIGPSKSSLLLLSPMQEMPTIGRNRPYIWGLFLFILFNMPPPVAGNNLAVLLVFRFVTGFVGSPALATGGASMTDIYRPPQQAMAIGCWAIAAACGPLLGPPIGGFPAQILGWRWPFYELLWLGGFTFVLLFVFLPETYEPTILLKRARRLRKATGNAKIRAACEVNMSSSVGFADVLWVNAKRAVQLSLKPAILVANVENHNFSIGQTSLAFLCFAVPAPFTLLFYWWYQAHIMSPRMLSPKLGKPFVPEVRLEIGLMGGLCIPVALLIFGWTGRNASVHWIWPMIGAGFYLPGNESLSSFFPLVWTDAFVLFEILYLTFQSILMYIGMSYPAFAASIFAGNDFFRSCFAAPFPLFGVAFFRALGIGGGNTFLAVASLFTSGFLYLIYLYGGRLRARSKFTG
ncbi:hypothetical protein JCM10213v2_002167 [Rhodosporidiobolus nylandii]